ncbi:MAG: hypothetical protein RLZ04_2604 [Actinomycetota bacterium]
MGYVQSANLSLLLLRVVFGTFLAAHGVNKVKGGIRGTAGWFGSIGMKWPLAQAVLAATTEIGAGLLLAVGLLTPLAAAGVVGVMVVAIVVAHRKAGFFVFRPGQGWEYCASIVAVAVAIGIAGPGEWSLDHVIGWHPSATLSGLVAGVGGLLAAALQLAVCWRPAPTPQGAAS